MILLITFTYEKAISKENYAIFLISCNTSNQPKRMNKFYTYFLLLLLIPAFAIGQKKSIYRPKNTPSLGPCTFPGTTPETAIPVCGTSVFTQENVFDCDIDDINPTECPGSNFPASKSFWYKFKIEIYFNDNQHFA